MSDTHQMPNEGAQPALASDPHSEAIDLRVRAQVAEMRGDDLAASRFRLQAFEKASEAVKNLERSVASDLDRYTTILTAATLALEARKYPEAQRYVLLGWKGNPPGEIRDALENIWFQLLPVLSEKAG